MDVSYCLPMTSADVWMAQSEAESKLERSLGKVGSGPLLLLISPIVGI